MLNETGVKLQDTLINKEDVVALNMYLVRQHLLFHVSIWRIVLYNRLHENKRGG